MRFRLFGAGSLIVAILLSGCSSPESAKGTSGASLLASDSAFSTIQNTSATFNLGSAAATGALVVSAPAHGTLSLDGTIATYRPSDPTFSGTDAFTFKLTNGPVQSNPANVSVTITPLASGTTTYVENYLSSAFALTGWRQFTSQAGHTANSITVFSSTTYNGVATASRNFGVYGDIASYAGDAEYGSLFSVLPVDGAAGAMHDWPWKAELIHIPQCGVDATITMKLVANGGQYPMAAILINYDIERAAAPPASAALSAFRLTGYQLLANSGGGSLTLSRFNKAHELATAYLDRWPNTNYGSEAMANPITSGPYKGWNYRNGVWPAGGNIGIAGQMLIAVRYQYDPTTATTTVSYEARQIDGTDLTPGSWDEVITLTGPDSLPPGGNFGIMALNYHTSTYLQTTDFDIPEYKLVCTLP